MSTFQVVIGRNELVDIVGTVQGVPAKIDSGAYRSSVHAKSFKLVKKEGQHVLSVELMGHPCSPEVFPMTFDEYERVKVMNSFGHEEERYQVTLRVKIGPKIFNSHFTLADRSNNLFPILIGRKALKHRFVVDVAKKNVDRIKLKKEFGVSAPIDEEDTEE